MQAQHERRPSASGPSPSRSHLAAAPEVLPGQLVGGRRAPSKPPASATASRAASAHSEIARSREVKRATTFSAVTGCPFRRLDGVIEPDVPRLLDDAAPPRAARRCAQAGAGGERDPHPRLPRLRLDRHTSRRRTPRSRGRRGAGRRAAGSGRRRSCGPRASSPLRTSSRPDQFSGTTVSPSPARWVLADAGRSGARSPQGAPPLGVAQAASVGGGSRGGVELLAVVEHLRRRPGRTSRRPGPGR